MINPAATRAPKKLKSAKNKTINPAVLKKRLDCSPFASFIDAKLIRARIGNVPSAKTNIIVAPAIKLPVVNEYTCIDCVNPHGKKKVDVPNKIGVRKLLLSLLSRVLLPNLLGRRSCSFLKNGNTPSKLIPRTTITKKSKRFKIKVDVEVSAKADPIRPITPPSIKKLMILDI